MSSSLFSGMKGLAAVAAQCVLLSGALSSTALADSQRFDIRAQDASTALTQFAQQAKREILFKSERVKGVQTNVVDGWYEPDEAIRKLLEGTGLVVSIREGGVLVVEAGSDISSTSILETVNVFGTLDNELSIGSKTGQSLRETPKSVTLMTRERLEAQNLSSLGDALAQTTGLTSIRYSGVDEQFYSRGQQIQNFQYDGGATGVSRGSPDMAMYERVEVLRGVDGVYTGAGEPGGVVNLVRKRAKSTPEAQAIVSGGSWNYYRGEFDVTGPLTDDARLRGRAVAAYQDNEYFFDRQQTEKTLVYGTAEYDLTDDTLLIAGARYERRKEDGYYPWGMGRYADGRDLRLPRSAAFNPDWSHVYYKTLEAFARVEQKFGESGVVKLNLSHIDNESELRQFLFDTAAVNPVTLTGPMARARLFDTKSVQSIADLSVSGKFTLFGLDHTYTAGVDYSKDDTGGQKGYSAAGYAWPGSIPVDVFNFDPSRYPEPVLTPASYYPAQYQAQQGVYAALGLQLAAPLRLTLGGRYTEYRYLATYYLINSAGVRGADVTTKYKEGDFIPSVALSWNFAPDWTTYASYAQTFRSQGNLLSGPLPGTPLPPITGDGYELGVKGEIFKVLNASAALYRVERIGQGAQDIRYAYTPGSQGSACCYLAAADIVMQGLDLELSGTVLPGWQMFAGYTYSSSETKGDASWTYFIDMTPKHLFKMWTTWQLPGQLARWTVNLGVIAQSEVAVNGTALESLDSTTRVPFSFAEGGRAVWNTSVQYRFSDNWSLGLYADNVFDKRYYQLHNSTTSGNVYGQPRGFILTLRGRW